MAVSERFEWRRILQVRFHPDGDGLVTAGDRHLRVWHIDAGRLRPANARLERRGSVQGFACVAFLLLRSDAVDRPKDASPGPGDAGEARLVQCAVTGNQDGGLYAWLDGRLVLGKKGAHQGPVLVLAAAHDLAGGDGSQTLLSGGVDGVVRRWDVTRDGRFQQVGAGRVLRSVLETRAHPRVRARARARACVRA